MKETVARRSCALVRALVTRALVLAIVCTSLLAAVACGGNPDAKKRAYVDSGDNYAKSGKFREAAIEYRNAVQIDPLFGQARAKLADAYLKLGDGRNALSESVRAADLLQDDLELQLSAGALLLGAGRVNDALARADAVLKKDSNNVAAHVLRGNALGGLNNLESALAEMEEAIRLDPTRGGTYTQLGFVHMALGRDADARAALEKAIELDPKAVTAHLALANFHWAAGRVREAEQQFDVALKLEPKNEGANRAMAVFSLTTGRTAKAEQYLKQVADTSKSASALFSLTDYYVATGRPKDAIALLEAASGVDMPDIGAKPRLARAYASSGDRDKANQIVDDLVKQNPRNAQAQLLKGQLQFDMGDRDAALASVRAAVASQPDSVQAQFALGRLYAARGDVSAAEKAFQDTLKLNPRAAAAQVELSLLRLASGNTKGSLELARQVASSQPESVDGRLVLARALVAAKDFGGAERELKALLTERPALVAAHVQSGQLASARGDVAGARRAFDRALELDGTSVEALAGLVALDLAAKNVAGARDRVAARLAQGKPAPALLILAARTYAAIGEPSKAEELLRQGIEAEPSFLPAYGMLAQLYLSQRKLDQARQELDTLAERQTNPVGALTMSGVILQSQARTAEARQRFERAVATDPRAAVAGNNLAWLYAESGQNLEQAVKLAEAAAREMPDVPEVQHTLGYVYFRSNLPALAVPALERALQKDPRNPVYLSQLGLAQEKLGNVAGAREALTRALELKPEFQGSNDARAALARLAKTN